MPKTLSYSYNNVIKGNHIDRNNLDQPYLKVFVEAWQISPKLLHSIIFTLVLPQISTFGLTRYKIKHSHKLFTCISSFLIKGSCIPESDIGVLRGNGKVAVFGTDFYNF